MWKILLADDENLILRGLRRLINWEELNVEVVGEALDGLPAVKVHCSVLAEEAVKSAVADYYKKNNIPFDAKLLECTEEGCCHLAAHGEEH